MCASWQGKYFEAICTDIDPAERSLVACFPPEAGLDDTCFKVPYDMLILGAVLWCIAQRALFIYAYLV